MKKLFFILLNIVAITGFFYSISPELLSDSIKNKIEKTYKDSIPLSIEIARPEIYNSSDPELYSMDALLNNNEAVITTGMTLLSSKIGSKENYISALKLKIIAAGRNVLFDAPFLSNIKKLDNVFFGLELNYMLMNIFSFLALFSIILCSVKFGLIGGAGVSVFYTLLWVIGAFYFRGVLTDSGTRYLSEIFKLFSELDFSYGVDSFFELNRIYMFKDILIKSGVFMIFGIYLGLTASSKDKKIEHKMIELETENKKNMAQLKRLQNAEEEFKKAGDKIAKLSSRVISLQMLSQVLGASLNLETALDEVINSASKLFGSKKCAIFLLDKKGENIYPKKFKGYAVSDLNGMKMNIKTNTDNIISYCLNSKNLITTDIAKKDFNIGEMMKKTTIDIAMIAPLVHGEDLLGAILIGDTESEKNIQDDGRLLLLLATLTALTIKNAQLYQKTVEMANTDGLTKMYNNRYFNDFLTEAIKNAQRTSTKVSLFMTDIDHFKNFNDVYGHQIGDFVLEQTAKIMVSLSREGDVAARYGGEEFVYVMPDTDTNEAMKMAENMRIAVQNKKYKHKEEELSVTISAGVATYPDHALTIKDLVKLADDGLYLSKEGGRNQVRCAPAEKGISSSDNAENQNIPEKTETPVAEVKPAEVVSKNQNTEDDIFKF
jgi:diguanylate cyclase (GGDEF)-like protein